MPDLHMDPCASCGKLVATHWKFCISCAASNLRFDPVEFALQLGSSVEDFRAKECNFDHPEAVRYIREMKEDPDLLFDNPFCSVCGARLIPSQN